MINDKFWVLNTFVKVWFCVILWAIPCLSPDYTPGIDQDMLVFDSLYHDVNVTFTEQWHHKIGSFIMPISTSWKGLSCMIYNTNWNNASGAVCMNSYTYEMDIPGS